MSGSHREEIAYVRRSLEDLEKEREAGDVELGDYKRLQERYRRQLSELEEHDDEGPGGDGSTRPARRHRLAFLERRGTRLVTGWGAFSLFLAAAVVLSLDLAGAGPFTPTPSLSVEARVQIMLAEASVLGGKGDVTAALATYDRVLALRPTQPVALADGGWLARLAGIARHDGALVRNGDAEIAAAVRSEPGYALARAYDGVAEYADDHRPARAVAEFDAMIRDDPSTTLLRSVRTEAVSAYRADHAVVPGPIEDPGGTAASS